MYADTKLRQPAPFLQNLETKLSSPLTDTGLMPASSYARHTRQSNILQETTGAPISESPRLSNGRR
jgi:hypothetical protein